MNTRIFVQNLSYPKLSFWTPPALIIGSFAFILSTRADTPVFLKITPTNSNLAVTWTNAGAVLQSAPIVTGPWLDLTSAISPFVVTPSNPAGFFRLRGPVVPDFSFRYLAPTFTTSIGDPFGCGCTSPENPHSLAAGGNSQDNGLGSVLLHTGELTEYAVDLAIPGRGFDWRFARAYRSGMSYDGPMGQGWDFNYNRRLIAETNGNVLRVDGLGRVDRYTLNTNGTFDSPGGIYTRLKRNLDGTFEERDRHGMTNFYAATNTLGVARLTRISDRNANQMTFQYNAAGQLTNVVDTLNRTNKFSYDANGRLTSVTDFSSHTVTFAYNATGDLVSATSPLVTGTPNGNDFPSGKTTLYTYASGFGDTRFNHNLLSVTAPNEVAVSGSARLAAQYDTNPISTNADRLVSLRLGGTNSTGVAAGGTIYYSYASFGPAGSNDFASPVFQNTVTNRNGNVTQYRFNQLGNIVRSIQFTRGLRPGEPPAFTNVFVYNKDGELIARTNAELDAVLYTFNSGSLDRLQQGNLLQVQQLPGPRGGDQTQIVTSQTYETNFNFVATATDARGNVTTYRYDAKGNRTNVVHRIPSIVEDFEYNAFGQLTAHVVPDNGSAFRRRDLMSYYTSGSQMGYLESRVVDFGGFNFTTTNEYDAVGNVVRVVDPRTNDTLYVYNALNQLVRESSRPVVGGIRYTNLYWYDANNNLVRKDVENRDADGVLQANAAFTTIFEYDILDRRTREVGEKGSATIANSVVTYTNIPVGLRPQFLTEEYRSDANGNQNLTRFGQATSGVDPFNLVATAYDERDLMFRETRAFGSANQSTLQTDYDRNGNTQRTLQGTESAPRTNSYTYDGFDRLVRTLDPMGNTRTNHYDANNNRVSERTDGELIDVVGSAGNVRLAEVLYAFDAMDRLTNRADQFFDPATQTPIDDGQAITKFTWSGTSQLLSTSDDNTNDTTYTFDRDDSLAQTFDAGTNTETWVYSAILNTWYRTNLDRSTVVGQSNQTRTATYQYDRSDRLVKRVDGGSNTTTYSYDSRSNPTGSTDGRGNRYDYTYDGRSRKVSTVHRLTNTGDGSGTVIGGITNSQTWDDSSRLVTQTDGNGNTTQYIHDSLNRLTATIFADGTTSSNTYDVHDNRIVTTDANGTIVTAAFDLLNRATNIVVIPAPGVSGTTNETYVYDGLSRIVQAGNDDSVVTSIVNNSYDSLSQLIGQLQAWHLSVTFSILNYVNLSMKYDGVGNLTQINYPFSGRNLIQTYDALNRLKVSRFEGAGPNFTNAVFQYLGPKRVARTEYGNGARMDATYDAVPRVQTIQHSLSNSPFVNLQFAWDQSHNLIASTNVVLGAKRTHQYDSLDRLVVTDDPTVYGLDAVGNRTNVNQGPGASTYTMDATLSEPADFQMNQYTTAPGLLSESFAYPDGNLAGKGAWTAHSAAGVVPVLVNGGKARLAQGAGSREDVNALLGATMHAGQKFYAAFDLVNTGGTGTVYFAHFKDAGTTNFAARVFITTNGLGDYTVGLSSGSATVNATWPAGLTFGATYRIVTSYEFSTGYAELWVNPVSPTSQSILSTGFTNDAVSAYALRQATPSSGTSTQTVDNLCVSDSFTNALYCLPTPRQYDSNGNLLSANGHTFNYDFRNRLIQVDNGYAAYKYDCYGRRFAKIVSGITNWVIYAGVDEIQEMNFSTTGIASYVRGNGELLQMTATNGQSYFFHCDQLGSPVAITGSNGIPVETNSFDDYGTPSSASSSIGNPFLFAGQRYDPETGWYLAGERYLDPAAGRFTTRTTSTLGNRYTFANNNPVSLYASSQSLSVDHEPYTTCRGSRRPTFTGHIPMLPVPPIELVPLEPVSGSGPDGVVVGGPRFNDPQPGGCPGLPDPRVPHDFSGPLALPATVPGPEDDPPGKPQEKPHDKKQDDDHRPRALPAPCVKMSKVLETHFYQVEVDNPYAVRLPLGSGKGGDPKAGISHSTQWIKLDVILVWWQCYLGGDMYEMFGEQIVIERTVVWSDTTSIEDRPVRR